MRRVPSLAVLCLVLVSASAASIDDPIPSQDRGDGVVADDDEQSGEVEEPKAASTWDYLAEKYDADGDGKITEEEYGRDELHFKRLDVDKDGVIAQAELDERDRSARGERGGRRGRGGRFGGGRGGRGRERWSGEERSSRGVAPLEGSEAPDFDLLVLSEKVSAEDAGGEEEDADEKSEEQRTVAEKQAKKLKLSSFKDKRPVALIFGSYT